MNAGSLVSLPDTPTPLANTPSFPSALNEVVCLQMWKLLPQCLYAGFSLCLEYSFPDVSIECPASPSIFTFQ